MGAFSMWKIYLFLSILIMCATSQKPAASTWAKHGNESRHLLGQWLVSGCLSSCQPNTAAHSTPIEYEGYDGFYNNMARPDLGAIDTPLLRRIPAAYEDGVYQPSGKNRPEPLDLSDKLMKGNIGTQSRLGRNALLVFFGQQVVEEILDAQRAACPPEYFNLKIPPDHTYRTEAPQHSVLPLLRTRYDARTGYSPNNPRQQLNEITPWLDGGLTYGTTKTWSDQLRTYANGSLDENGLLAFSHDGLFPEYNTIRLPMANPPPPAHHGVYIARHSTEKVERFFKLGNPRGNENPFLLSFGVLWFRWHNYLAKEIKKANPAWNGEKIFNEARKWVIASHQHIVVNKWLPTWLGSELADYPGYDPSIDPQIDQFFQSAAFRFGHTLVPPGVYLRDYARNGCGFSTLSGGEGDKNGTVRTCNSFWQPQKSIQSPYQNTSEVMDIDRLLMGMALQLSEEEDHKIVEDLRGNVFGPLEFSRRDLMAVNIQRGRDHGLPDYNTIRRAFDLDTLTRDNIESIFPNASNEIRQEFLNMHNDNLDNVDLWVGGLLETGDGPGPLFTKIIKDQFRRIRDGDRFWYRNKQNGLFTNEEILRLERLEFYDIIMAVTKMDHDDIQPIVFRAPTSMSEISSYCHPQLAGDTNCTNGPCYHLPQLNANTVATCVKPGKYDFFSNSEGWFIGTYVGVGVIILSFFGIVKVLAVLKNTERANDLARSGEKARQSFRKSHDSSQSAPCAAHEWVEHNEPMRQVLIVLDSSKRQIQVRSQHGKIERAIDVTHTPTVQVTLIADKIHLMLRCSPDYDLMLKFGSDYLRSKFLDDLEEFIGRVGVNRERVNMPLKAALKQIVTRKCRQKRLEVFFRVVFSQAFGISHSEKETLKHDSEAAKEIIYTELTIGEFAEALSMRADSEFVQKMFSLADKDKNGFMSFREFCDMLIIFANGNADDKVKLMFDMYDINQTGMLTKEDFKNMIKSFMETVRGEVNVDVKQEDLDKLITHMLHDAGLANKDAMDIKDFQRLLLDHKDNLNYTVLNFPGVSISDQAQLKLPKTSKRSVSFIELARQTTSTMYHKEEGFSYDTLEEHKPLAVQPSIDMDQESAITQSEPPAHSIFRIIRVYIENSYRDLFWMTLFTLVLLAIFAERAYYYSVEREHSGLRRIAGYGVTVTRGAASAMMFTYSSLLVTMCRNTITLLRETFLHAYFPFDSAVFMHKYIASWALFFTVMHVAGHAFNFYSISTQTSNDLTCLFRNFFHSTHEIPKFQYWCWQTITGVTGILLTLLTSLIFIFAMPYARRKLYNAFWFTHSLYPLFYILLILHGTGRLVQPPFTHYYFLGPCILFLFDRMVTLKRKKVVIHVIKAELLPSAVTMLEFKKPSNFEYKSGQWVRIACLGLNTSEFHPFTISSAPNEKNLTLHIRAVGPWTKNLRRVYENANSLQNSPLPKIHLDGPYGEGHQDWYQSDVAVLVGGGIGVTPFASILKDIVFRRNINQTSTCKKVYFVWVTKTQKQFEWLVDIIRELENVDENNIVSVHIYITQFYEKFDLRTILLYICERHFQKVCSRSLFTGLKAVTHFGRPNFAQFFKSLQQANPTARQVGVFSCGPPPMTAMVDKDCVKLNNENEYGPIFKHHSKNF